MELIIVIFSMDQIKLCLPSCILIKGIKKLFYILISKYVLERLKLIRESSP